MEHGLACSEECTTDKRVQANERTKGKLAYENHVWLITVQNVQAYNASRRPLHRARRLSIAT